MVRAREQRLVIGLLVPLMAAHVLSGCGSLSPVPPAEVAPAVGVESAIYHHSVYFLSGASDLTDSEAKSLELFLATLPLESRIDFRLSWRADEEVAKARIFGLAARRVSSIAKHIRQLLGERVEFEIKVSNGRGTHPQESSMLSLSGSSSVEISVTSHRVRMPNCPIWTDDLGFDPSSLPSRNLGCASAINLGLMIADPADLEQGRSFGGSDGAREADAVGRYRADKVKELRREGVNKQ